MRGNQRRRVLIQTVCSLLFLLAVCAAGYLCRDRASMADFTAVNLKPCLPHPFGTDWMGRDMFARTMRGLSISMFLGMLAAAVSAAAALLLGTCSVLLGSRADRLVGFLIDLVMGIPHMLLLILISVACNRGFAGVCAGIALTHWPSLTRVIRAEVMQLRDSIYIQTAAKLGKGRLYIVCRHMLPHLASQFLVGLILLFPHAILHESSITFLGFGLSSEQPAIGIVLSESMKYLVTGKWWLAFFPGLFLMMTVMMFYTAGENIRRLADPGSVHE